MYYRSMVSLLTLYTWWNNSAKIMTLKVAWLYCCQMDTQISAFRANTSQIKLNLHQTFQHVIHQSSCSGIQNMQLKYRHRPEVCDNCKHRLQGQNVQTENMELYKTVHYKQGGENRLLCSSVNSLKENKTLTSCKNHKVGNCGNLFKVCISDQKTNCMATVKSIIITINCPPSFGM